jgi:ADP-L-glycero-D-manno-heptose 6-epimerase
VIVVTGAAGFIGSNIVADLLAEDRSREIVVVDRFGTDERWRNLARHPVDHFVDPTRLDIFLAAHGDEIEAIIHMGAIATTTERDVDRLVRCNIEATVQLWDWCAMRQVPFLYASSAATYGGRERGFADDDSPDALAALAPLNAYGWSKHATDMLLARRVAAGRPAPPFWAGLKFFNVYGPNEYHKGDMASVAYKLHAQAMRGETVHLFRSYRPGIADGEQRRDFIHVRDCTRAILWLLNNRGRSGLYNVGTGEARSFLDVVRALARAMGREVNVEFIDMPEPIRARYQYFTEADTAKLRGAGLTAPCYTLEQGIADYVRGYLGRDDGYR